MAADPQEPSGPHPAELIRIVTKFGLAADHPEVEQPPVVVAPAVGGGFNHVRRPFFPKACWLLDDAHFDFDSSVPLWSTFNVAPLESLLIAHPGAKLSIFGHADPTGKDEYNSTLSGRRAKAIFALLVRRPKVWEELYAKHDTVGHDEWGLRAINRMLTALGFDAGPASMSSSPALTDAWHAFQDRSNLKRTALSSGDHADRTTLLRLFDDYMALVMGKLTLAPDDFLGGGTDPDGKADYQGCGEFNPVRIFSRDEAKAFEQPALKTERDQANQPNRRVVVLLFRPDAEVDPSLWPCPTVKQGPAACRKRFHSDAKERLANGDRRREYPADKTTFACRFYDRLTDGSPCEGIRVPLRVRLLNSLRDPIPKAPYRLSGEAGFDIKGQADADGWLLEDMVPAPSRCTLQWGYPGLSRDPEQPDVLRLPFSTELVLRPDVVDRREAAARRLLHLGYSASKDLAQNVLSFQRDYEVGKLDGNLDDETDDALRRVHDLGLTREELHQTQQQ
jgi:outer membrane protein OmpA-like peptidoglycan-associated protein